MSKKQNGVSVILITPTNEVILVLRADGGGWEPPTGGIDLSETSSTAAAREVFEETGIVLNQEDLTLDNIFYLKDGSTVESFFVFVDHLDSLDIEIQLSEVIDVKSFSVQEIRALREKEESRLLCGPISIGYCSFHRIMKTMCEHYYRIKRGVSKASKKQNEDRLMLMDSFTERTGREWSPV